MRVVVALASVLALGACQTLTTPQACQQASSRLAGVKAGLDAATAALPGLQAAVTTACGEKASKACTNAETAFAVAQAAIPGLQAAVAAEQANVNAECSTKAS